MKHCAMLIATALFGGIAFADDTEARTLLLGQWQSQGGDEQNSVWTIEQKGDQIRVAASKGDLKFLEFECKPLGVDCEAKGAGKSAKISMYFNGPALVQLETKGSEVTKRRFTAKDQDSMDIELIPLVPGGNPETMHMKRIHNSAAAR
jgi:hypothetical protein